MEGEEPTTAQEQEAPATEEVQPVPDSQEEDKIPGGAPGDADEGDLVVSRSGRVVPAEGIFIPTEEQVNQQHKFWGTQPVPKMSTAVPMTQVHQSSYGAINDPMSVDDVKADPYNLPGAFEWVDIDIFNEEWAQKVYTLLLENYVEDDDAMFRFDYSIPFLRWALTPENFRQDWHVGVVVKTSRALVGFITAIPASLNVYDSKIQTVEINFLCVHKRVRDKRLAPVLIKEITRRVNRQNIWQAVYTAGVVLPTPIAQCTYYHRSLNPKKLIDVGFSRLGRHMNMSRTIRLYKLPEQPLIPGIRPMTYKDIPQVVELLNGYLSNFSLWVDFSPAEIEHFFLPREDVIYSFVVPDPETGKITDMCSFYSLTSSILKHRQHTKLKAAYSYYNVPGKHTMTQLFRDMLIIAKSLDFDVFNALNAMDNPEMFKELRFGIGDGNLQFYLYNWGCESMPPQKVGLILV